MAGDYRLVALLSSPLPKGEDRVKVLLFLVERNRDYAGHSLRE